MVCGRDFPSWQGVVRCGRGGIRPYAAQEHTGRNAVREKKIPADRPSELELQGADILLHPVHPLVLVTAEAGLLQGQVLLVADGLDVEFMGRLRRLIHFAGAVALGAGVLRL